MKKLSGTRTWTRRSSKLSKAERDALAIKLGLAEPRCEETKTKPEVEAKQKLSRLNRSRWFKPTD